MWTVKIFVRSSSDSLFCGRALIQLSFRVPSAQTMHEIARQSSYAIISESIYRMRS